MLQHISGIVLLAAITISLSHAASFDCNRASTAVEKLICNDPDLSRLDSELNARYREQLSAGTPGLVEEQRSWLAKRNACNNTACIKIHYLNRLSEVTERGKSLADIAARLEIPQYERDREFCPRLLDHLKRWQDVAEVAPVVTADSIDAPTRDERPVSDVIDRLDTFAGVLEFAGERYLFDASHHPFELLWSVTFTRPEPAGSAKVARSCHFIAKDENPFPVGTPVGPRRPGDPGYGDIRIEVLVRKAAPVSTSAPRPANFYQLAGNAGGQACHDSLAVLNRPGTYSGEDGTRWLLASPDQVEFRSLEAGAATYAFPGLEYASVDIDRDGQAEHVYRLNSVLHSQWHQELMIVPYMLQNHPERLAPYGQECLRVAPSAGCDSTDSRIRFAFHALVSDKLSGEWAFTRNDIWNHVTNDTASQRLIAPHDRNRDERNPGSSTGVYWSLYEMQSSVIAVSAPIYDFATPELLVFAPRENQSGVLLCVIMPVAWHK